MNRNLQNNLKLSTTLILAFISFFSMGQTHTEKQIESVFKILNGFKLENNLDEQTILFAQGNGYIEQLVSDGHIENGDFEKRIDLVINNTKNFMKANNCESVENSFKFYKDYTNGSRLRYDR